MRTSREIVNYLNNLRKQQGMSITELANRVGMAKSGVSKYFNYSREFPINRAPEFANALHVSTYDILGIDVEPKALIKVPLITKFNSNEPISENKNIEREISITKKNNISTNDFLFAIYWDDGKVLPIEANDAIMICKWVKDVSDGQLAVVLFNNDTNPRVGYVRHLEQEFVFIPYTNGSDSTIVKHNEAKIIGKPIESIREF